MERFGTRRSLIVGLAIGQSLLWSLILTLTYTALSPTAATTVLIIFAVAYHSLGGFINPIWNSLIGDIVPETFRGRFFARRNAICSGATLLGVIGAGAVLHLSAVHERKAIGFAVIFAAAAAARLSSAYWLSRHDDLRFSHGTQYDFTMTGFLGRLFKSNFGRFVLFVAAINFSVWIAAPYFAVYMLTVLRLSYAEYAGLLATSVISQVVMLQFVGTLSDRFGNRIIMKVCSVGICIVPCLWVFTSSVMWLACIQFMAGLSWAGHNLAASNFIFDAVTPQRRPRCVAYQAAINGVAVFSAASLGGYIATHAQNPIPFHRWFNVPESIFTFIFLLSGGLRLLSVLIFQPLFREVRDVEPIGSGRIIFGIAAIRAAATFAIRPVARLPPTQTDGDAPDNRVDANSRDRSK